MKGYNWIDLRLVFSIVIASRSHTHTFISYLFHTHMSHLFVKISVPRSEWYTQLSWYMTRYPNFRLSFFLFPYFIFTLSHFGFPSPGWFEITHHTYEFNLHITSSQQCWIHFNAKGLFFLLYEHKKKRKKKLIWFALPLMAS